MNVFKFLLIASLVTLLGVQPSLAETQTATQSDAVEVSTPGVNINTASVEILAAELKGVGKKRAQAIVDYREKNGAFTDINQLIEIKGISQLTVENNIDKIRL